ncbi:hypothetical protein L0F63_004559 [Massospora cicadina]|nr:hypothetical protein L0F63_004559 [Massospora cicadina]
MHDTKRLIFTRLLKREKGLNQLKIPTQFNQRLTFPQIRPRQLCSQKRRPIFLLLAHNPITLLPRKPAHLQPNLLLVPITRSFLLPTRISNHLTHLTYHRKPQLIIISLSRHLIHMHTISLSQPACQLKSLPRQRNMPAML